MPKHPLTNKKAFKKFWDHTVDLTTEVLYTPDGIRAAADWQLEQVMKWLDKNICNYTDADYLGDCEPFYLLESHLKEAMRPTQEKM